MIRAATIRLVAWWAVAFASLSSDATADTIDELAPALAKFDSAVAAYHGGDYSAAHADFTKIAEHYVSPELCLNAGSAAYRVGSNGEAVLWFRRALVLDSKSGEAKQNLRFLKRRLGFLNFDDGAMGQYGGVLPTPVWRFWFALSTGSAAVCLISVVTLRLRTTAKSRIVVLMIVATICSAITGTGWWANANARPALSIQVVVEEGTTALAAPNSSAGRVVVVPPGTEVAFLERRGSWIYTEIPGGSRGWIRASHLEQLWPFSVRLIE